MAVSWGFQNTFPSLIRCLSSSIANLQISDAGLLQLASTYSSTGRCFSIAWTDNAKPSSHDSNGGLPTVSEGYQCCMYPPITAQGWNNPESYLPLCNDQIVQAHPEYQFPVDLSSNWPSLDMSGQCDPWNGANEDFHRLMVYFCHWTLIKSRNKQTQQGFGLHNPRPHLQLGRFRGKLKIVLLSATNPPTMWI